MFQALSAWVVAATRRRPFVLEIRDLWPDDMVASGVLRPHGLAARAFRRLEAFLYRRARRVVVNSPAFMGYLEQRKGLEPARLACVPNGVDAAMFDPAARGETLRRQWGAEGKVTATYAGALGAANDIPTILRAAQRLQGIPDLQFVLVGGGNRSEEAHKLSAALNLANVTFAGAAPKSLMCEVLAASDICLATLEDNLLFETVYPNKVFDYMAAGRPTVLAVRGAIRGVLVDAQAGIPVPPGDDEALAAAVTKLHGDPVTRQVMGDAGRAYVKRHCRRADHARAFCDILRVVADER
jgi:glycosyltransferase involved in cell wall biosynthesis